MARDLDIDFSSENGQVTAALAALGFAVVPNPYSSLLSVESTRKSDIRFRNGQLGGGRRLQSDRPLYFEGYVAFQNYAPEYSSVDGASDDSADVRWTSFSSTLGVGWEFPLLEGLVLRPTLDVALGRITSSADVSDDNEDVTDYIAGDGMYAGGYGGALTLDYKYRAVDKEIDLILRTTAMRLVPLGDFSDVDVSANVATTAGVARLRRPIRGWSQFGGPVRSVYEASYAAYTGDQGEVLDIPWLARVGVGLEFETGHLARYAPSRTRVMFRVVSGDNGFTALTFGAGISF
ncbi:hypothetical protein BV911_01840 [Pseudoruegeria sp. SK021]|nr:hypothetical protein BV911_01840 [Pseudoruegeria sp. SK021]